MSRKVSIEEAIREGEQIARVWTDNPTFSLGEVTLQQLQTMLTDLRNLRAQLETLRNQLTATGNDASDKAAAVSGIVTRARSGFRAVFGPDSTQYEQAGGTRISDRKRPTRKQKPTNTTNN